MPERGKYPLTGAGFLAGFLESAVIAAAAGFVIGVWEVFLRVPDAVLIIDGFLEVTKLKDAVLDPLGHTYVRDNFVTIPIICILLTIPAYSAFSLYIRMRPSWTCNNAAVMSTVFVITIVILNGAFFYVPRLPIIQGSNPVFITLLIVSGILVSLWFVYHQISRSRHLDNESAMIRILSQALWFFGFFVALGPMSRFSRIFGPWVLFVGVPVSMVIFGSLYFVTKRGLSLLFGEGKRRLFGSMGVATIILLLTYVSYFHFIGYKTLPEPAKEISEAPNLVMIVLDTVRADRLSVYGYERETTPFLESIAKEGAVFDMTYTNSPWTLPSHATFFTGLYPSDHEAVAGIDRLDDRFITLAERLKERGYITAGFSCNPHVSRYTNIDQGFDRLLVPRNVYLGSPIYSGERFARYFLFLLEPLSMIRDSGSSQANHIASEWISELSRGNRPFFLFVNYMEAHLPYPQNNKALKYIGNPEAAMVKIGRGNNLDWTAYNAGYLEVPEEVLAIFRDWYDGAVYYQDSKVAELVGLLRDNEVLDNTVLIILSDHGESLSERGYYGHGFGLYEELLRVPLIIRYPGPVEAGKRVPDIVQLKELPQMIDFLLSERPLTAFISELASENRDIYAERYKQQNVIDATKKRFPDWDESVWDRDQRSLMERPYKLIWDSTGEDKLFRLDLDPLELTNRTAKENNKYHEMQEKMNSFIFEHPKPELRVEEKELDPDHERRLRALGYIK